MRVLLIDDDEAVHREVAHHLAAIGCDLVATTEPEEGLRLVLAEQPDVVLLDLHLPRMDGLKVCRHLKELEATRDIPVVFVTVDGSVDHLARALDCGGDDYLRKPVEPVELCARVRAAARHRELVELLKQRAAIDALTGLRNRAAMDDALAAATAAASRTGQPLALLLLDLDSFKQVNDVHGHAVGDELLGEVGRRLQATCRPYDVACRYGGDEFAVIFGQVEGEPARRAAVRVHDALQSEPARTRAGELRIALSGGLACTDRLRLGFAADEALKAADAALYAAKRARRGRVRALGDAD